MAYLLRVWLLSLLSVGWLLAEPSTPPNASAPASALTIFNAYLAQAAMAESSYRTDLQPCTDPLHIPLGRLLGQGPMIGAFTYRPKTYNELSREERESMLHDPKFHAFLIVAREQADADDGDNQSSKEPAANGGAKDSAPDNSGSIPVHPSFSISPEEMLQRRPMFVVFPHP